MNYTYSVLEDENYRKKVAKRILKKSVVDEKTGCRNWSGYTRDGYGHIHIKHHFVTVHRVAYEVFVGPIPEGKILMHRCDNPSCIEPDHLKIGTRGENNKDRSLKNRTAKQFGSSNGMAKLKEDDVIEIKEFMFPYLNSNLYSEMKNLAAYTFGVTSSNIHNIMKGKSWKNVGIRL